MAKKKRRKSKRSSRFPAFVLVLVAGAVAGAVAVSALRDTENTSTSTPSVDTTAPVASTPATSVDTTSATIESVAPPVTVGDDPLGDAIDGAVIDDFTPVEPPDVPAQSSPVSAAWVKKGVITARLPDGQYWGYLAGSSDEPDRVVSFEVSQVFWGQQSCRARFGDSDDACTNDYGVDRTVSGRLDVVVADLIFVSLATLGDPSTGDFVNRSISPAAWWSLVNSGQSVTPVPSDEPDQPASEAFVDMPYLLTVIDGVVVGAEVVRVP